MLSKEQHMKIIENQRKIYEQIKEKPMKSTEKSKKEQWKTMENQRQFCQHSKLLFASDFWPLFFFEFSIFNGERNKRNFEGKKTCLEVPWILYVHKTP